MSKLPLRHQAFVAVVLAMFPGAAGCSASPPAPESEGTAEPAATEPAAEPPAAALPAGSRRNRAASSGTELTCEVYCSESKLGTAIARLSWLGPAVLAASAEPIAEELQTTVYKGGFDRDLYASFQVGEPSVPQATPEPQAPPELPAYDLQISRVERPDESPAAGTGEAARTTVEIEGLEPGMKYTWRVVFDTPGGQQATETVTCEAPVCTADQADGMPNFGGS